MGVSEFVILACAKECERQETSPMGVYNLVKAWKALVVQKPRVSFKMSHQLIKHIGKMVEPGWVRGYRVTPVTFANLSSGLEPAQISTAMTALIDAINSNSITAQDAYVEFQKIHPFIDGNGRTGWLLYNWMNGVCDMPVFPVEGVF